MANIMTLIVDYLKGNKALIRSDHFFTIKRVYNKFGLYFKAIHSRRYNKVQSIEDTPGNYR